MRTEDYIRRGKLAELRDRLEACKKKIERLLSEIRVAAFPLQGVDRVDAVALQQATEELTREQERFLELKGQIAELED
jgi:hypothetical protein